MRHACAITQSKVAHRRRIMESIQSYESAMTFAMLRLVDVLLHLREPRIHQSESSSYAFPPARKLSIAAPSDQPSPAGDSALIQNQPIRSTPAGSHPFVTRGLDPRARGCPAHAQDGPANPAPTPDTLRSAARLASRSQTSPPAAALRLTLAIPGHPPPPSAPPPPPPSGFAGMDCHGPMDPPKMSLTGQG
jgi:hypothetical protein